MKVLVIGGGGREHALAWKLAQCERVQTVFVAPGNGGTATDAPLHNVALSDPAALADFAAAEKVALTVVGPETPLAAGVVDEFRAHGLRVFGPTMPSANSPRPFCQQRSAPSSVEIRLWRNSVVAAWSSSGAMELSRASAKSPLPSSRYFQHPNQRH